MPAALLVQTSNFVCDLCFDLIWPPISVSSAGKPIFHLSHLMRKPTICIDENKDADQLRGADQLRSADQLRCNRKADQRLCFHYSDRTIPLLLKSEISSF